MANQHISGYQEDEYDDVTSVIRLIIANQLGLQESRVLLTSRFVEDLGADSLDVVELIMALEEEFEIDFPEALAGDMILVSDAVNYVKKQLELEAEGFN